MAKPFCLQTRHKFAKFGFAQIQGLQGFLLVEKEVLHGRAFTKQSASGRLEGNASRATAVAFMQKRLAPDLPLGTRDKDRVDADPPGRQPGSGRAIGSLNSQPSALN